MSISTQKICRWWNIFNLPIGFTYVCIIFCDQQVQLCIKKLHFFFLLNYCCLINDVIQQVDSSTYLIKLHIFSYMYAIFKLITLYMFYYWYIIKTFQNELFSWSLQLRVNRVLYNILLSNTRSNTAGLRFYNICIFLIKCLKNNRIKFLFHDSEDYWTNWNEEFLY